MASLMIGRESQIPFTFSERDEKVIRYALDLESSGELTDEMVNDYAGEAIMVMIERDRISRNIAVNLKRVSS
jgi:hypothetical protein